MYIFYHTTGHCDTQVVLTLFCRYSIDRKHTCMFWGVWRTWRWYCDGVFLELGSFEKCVDFTVPLHCQVNFICINKRFCVLLLLFVHWQLQLFLTMYHIDPRVLDLYFFGKPLQLRLLCQRLWKRSTGWCARSLMCSLEKRCYMSLCLHVYNESNTFSNQFNFLFLATVGSHSGWWQHKHTQRRKLHACQQSARSWQQYIFSYQYAAASCARVSHDAAANAGIHLVLHP